MVLVITGKLPPRPAPPQFEARRSYTLKPEMQFRFLGADNYGRPAHDPGAELISRRRSVEVPVNSSPSSVYAGTVYAAAAVARGNLNVDRLSCYWGRKSSEQRLPKPVRSCLLG